MGELYLLIYPSISYLHEVEIGCDCAILLQQTIECLLQSAAQRIHQIGEANSHGTAENVEKY